MPGIRRTLAALALLIGTAHCQWSLASQPFQPDQKLLSVAWSGSLFIAVGSAGAIYSSRDGMAWAPVACPPGSDLNSVIWAGGKFVAVGTYRVLTSTDGSTWSSQALSVPSPLLSVTWTGSQYVAVGGAGTGLRCILTSPDAVQWTARTDSSGGDIILYSVAWGNGTLVAAGGGTMNGTSLILVSRDGITWTQVDHHLKYSAAYFSVTWTHDRFVVCSYEGSVATSPDGENWTEQESGVRPLYASAWTGSQFVAGGKGFAYSADGTVWNASETEDGAGTILHGMVWDDSLLVAVGERSGKGAILIGKPAPSMGIRAVVDPFAISAHLTNADGFSATLPPGFVAASLCAAVYSARGARADAATIAVSGSRITVDTDRLPAGRYFLEIRAPGKTLGFPFSAGRP